jgi:hypothetical protein
LSHPVLARVLFGKEKLLDIDKIPEYFNPSPPVLGSWLNQPNVLFAVLIRRLLLP